MPRLRDLRYWNARRETAEVSIPEPDSDVVRFGMTVTIEDEDGMRKTWRIVGEDEADAAHGKISHVSPMAQALFGKKIGETGVVSDREWEIVALDAGA
jgi:transcription elongation GreA/GreB family factor